MSSNNLIKGLLLVIGLICVVQCIQIQVEPYGHYDNHHSYGGHPSHGGQHSYVVKKPLRKAEKEEKQDFSKIPGQPGVDYPIYHSVPDTSFHCGNVPATPGMYANVETGCQAYHVCHDGREGHQGASFLCTNGTIFNQKEFACDWWYNVKCEEAVHYYELNADPEHNPYTPKKKLEDKFLIHA